jgi:hypothetical protein
MLSQSVKTIKSIPLLHSATPPPEKNITCHHRIIMKIALHYQQNCAFDLHSDKEFFSFSTVKEFFRMCRVRQEKILAEIVSIFSCDSDNKLFR